MAALFKHCAVAPLLFVVDERLRDPLQYALEVNQLECAALLRRQLELALQPTKDHTRHDKVQSLCFELDMDVRFYVKYMLCRLSNLNKPWQPGAVGSK